MTSPILIDELEAGINCALAIGGLAILYALYREYRVDKVRDDIFAIRDELFDFACDEKLLDHLAYTRLRLIMNSMLRFAHKITFLRFIFVLIFARSLRPKPNPFLEWKAALGTLPPEQMKKLEEYHLRMWGVALLYMCETSILMWIVRGILFLARCFTRMKEPAVTLFMKAHGVEQIEAQAFTFLR